jgi:hypothetical protein
MANSSSTKLTKRQREVFDYLGTRAAFSRSAAHTVYGVDHAVADKLAQLGIVNKRYDTKHGEVYWIRPDEEASTGSNVLAGFLVVLQRDLTTPSGKRENFFLARAPYDGKGARFRQLLKDWKTKLQLTNKDFLGYGGFEVHDPDEPIFRGDHVILDELP